jgi:autotransporter-associated beta strand protein
LSGPGGLVKQGNGTLTLTQAQTYGGATQITGGVLGGFVRLPAATLLSDSLLSTTLNPANWTTNTTGAAGGAAVNPTVNGVQLVRRGYLNTASQYDPTLVGGLNISGSWQFTGSTQDFFQLDTRSSGMPAGTYGEVSNGVEFEYTQGNAAPTIQIKGNNYSLGNLVTAGNLNVSINDKLSFIAIDGGQSNLLSFNVRDLANSTTGSATATLTSAIDTVNYVTFHNREQGGDTSLLSNVVIANVTGPIGSILPTAPLTISGGGTFDMTGVNQTVASLSSTDGLGSQVLASSGALTIAGTASSTFDGVISGVRGSLVVQGGRMALTGTSTYTGGTTINGGTLQLGDGSNGHDGSLAGAGVNNNGALVYNLAGAQTVAYGIGGQGSLTKSGTGTLTLTNLNSYIGITSVNGGTLQLGDGAPGDDGSINNTNRVTDNGTLVFDLAGSQSAAYAINGSGRLTKSGTGALTLSGTNTYSGGTSVSDGTLIVTNNAAIADGTSLTVGNASFFPAPIVPASASSSAAAVLPVPEPGALALAASALAAAVCVRRYRRQRDVDTRTHNPRVGY